MSAAQLALPGMLVALGWAALLALAEGALAAQPKLMELALAGGYADKPERFRRRGTDRMPDRGRRRRQSSTSMD